MSRSKAFLINVLSASALQIATVIAGFIVPRVFLTAYGSEINGLVTSLAQFIAYFNLVEAGLASAAVFSLYKPLAEKNHVSINAILSASRNFYNRSGYVFVFLVIGLAVVYPTLIRSESLSGKGISVLVVILGISGALEFFTMARYRVLLTADQKIYVLSCASICSILLNTVIIAVLASMGYSIVTVRGVALFSVFLRSILLHIYVKKKYRFADYHVVPDNDALRKRWDAFYLQVLGVIHTGAPVIIATFFTTLKMVSVYSIFHMVLAGVNGILSVAINGLFASFGDVIARGEQKVLESAYEEFELVYYMVISVAYGCTSVLLMPFIALYTRGVTDANYYLPLLGGLFVLNGLLNNLKTPQGMLIISAGLFRETRIQTTIQGMISVLGGLVFVQFWGLQGILFGSILSNIYRGIDLLFFVPKHITHLPVGRSFIRIVRVFFSLAFIISPFFFVSLDPHSYYQWIVYAILVGFYASTIVGGLNFILEKKTFLKALKRFTRLFVSERRISHNVI